MTTSPSLKLVDSPRAQTCTFKGPGIQTPPKFHEKTPREREKERKWGREREKKARNFGRSGGGGVQRAGGPAEGVSGGRNEKNQKILAFEK